MKIIVDTPAAQQQTATINYAAPRPVNIGDVFYRVECGELQHFREPCRVCGDKRTLTINGITFAYPLRASLRRYVKRLLATRLIFTTPQKSRSRRLHRRRKRRAAAMRTTPQRRRKRRENANVAAQMACTILQSKYPAILPSAYLRPKHCENSAI